MTYKTTSENGQMKVESEFLVNEDKIPVEPEELAGGTIYNDHSLKTVHHSCVKPSWDYNVYLKLHQWKASVEKIPDGTFWECDDCKKVYYAASDTSMAQFGMFDRKWLRLRWYNFALNRRWKNTKTW